MKMLEEIKHYDKEYVFEQYTRIVSDWKEYEKITKTKMLEAIYKVYDNPGNIIDICTTRELKYLKLILDNKLSNEYTTEELLLQEFTTAEDKYEWERNTLRDKFIIDFRNTIPEEIKTKVKEAIKRVNWQDKKKIDDLNELLVSYCKIQGTALLNTVCQFASGIAGIDEKMVFTHIVNNRLFNYYVCIENVELEILGEQILAIHREYYEIFEEINYQRKQQGLAGDKKIDIRVYKTLFYNDFDINNPKIKKFLDELKSLNFFWHSVIGGIKDFAMLNIDRKQLKESIKSIPLLRNVDLTHFFKTMDEAMDEMPSGALNGFTPNEAKKILKKKYQIEKNKAKKYIKQQNACLSKKDAKLFYKIYFGLLEFTNKKYKINKNIKIYNHNGINPYELRDIVDKYWENKVAITFEFCLANPYKFTKEELEITQGFKNGIREIFIIARYELEYTAFMHKDKIYMVKGLNDNIDNIISYKDLPSPVITSIIPFKNYLVYDGMFLEI